MLFGRTKIGRASAKNARREGGGRNQLRLKPAAFFLLHVVIGSFLYFCLLRLGRCNRLLCVDTESLIKSGYALLCSS